MRIIFVAGGTSGHINPAINIANYIRDKNKDIEILFVGSKVGLEVDLVKKENFNFRGITVSGFSRKINLDSFFKNIKSIKNIFVSSIESRKIIKEFKPDICIGTGGYVTGAFLLQASLMKIPFFIQEQNAIPGFTTKILSKRAKFVLLGNQDAQHYIKTNNCVYTGNPIKNNLKKLSKENAKNILNIKSNLPIILSFGGSLGSNLINNVILEVIKTNKYFHIHSSGKNNKRFNEILNKMNLKNAQVNEYIYNIEECMMAADIVICRAGAMTLSELSSFGKKAILIPSPNVTNNHQYHNAVSYTKKFKSSVIEEKNLTPEVLIKEVDKLLINESETNEFHENIACETIYNMLNFP